MAELSTTTLATDSSLGSYYKLEDTSDTHGSNPLTNNGTVTFDTGHYHDAADGGSSNTAKYLNTSSKWLSSTQMQGSFSIVGWVNVTTLPGSGKPGNIFFNREGSPNEYSITVSVQPDGTIDFSAFYNGSFSISSSTTITTGQWFHVAITSTSGTQKLYINGNVVGTGSNTISGNAGNFGNPSGSSILSINNGSSNFLSGKVDDVAIFTRVLTQSEIRLLSTDASVTNWLGKYIGA